MRHKRDWPERALSEVAAGQHGIVTSKQLEACGLDRSAVARRVRTGWLHRVHRGVYAVGPPGLSREAEWMAAVLAHGTGAVLSHASAAVHWELLRPLLGPIHVSVPSQNGRRPRAGVRLHRCPSLAPASAPCVSPGGDRSGSPAGNRSAPGLPPDDDSRTTLITVRDNIPVTTPARTIADLQADRTVAPQLVRRARRQAELASYALTAGARRLRTRSDLEDDFLALCRAHGLPRPEVNVPIGPRTIDFVWRAAGVAVETDSYRYHRGSVSFEEDHARDLALRGAGFAVCRFTERQIRDEAELVAADLRRALRRS